ncbi:MAG: hypothetical protein E7202_06980 [Selenomonas ruminantium]|jgi:TPR repeat protein/GTPase SAR1 family protein|nr:hypothetical protein [Selenomonas ruminantium]
MQQGKIATILEQIQSFRQLLNQDERYQEELDELDEMLEDTKDPLLIMVMGEFSTGKSTFINALVGQEVAAMNATPTTAVITKLCYGAKDEIVVYFRDGSQQQESVESFARLTAEADEVSNRRHASIDYVERRMPLPVLKSVTIIDSPGLNAIKEEHGVATRRFMDKADTVIWMFSIENAASQSEFDAMAELNPRLRPIALINKMDLVDDEDEESPEELLAEIQGKLGERVQAVMGISAEMALRGKLENNAGMLAESGLDAFYDFIEMSVLPQREVYKLNTLLTDLTDFVGGMAETLDTRDREIEAGKDTDYGAYIEQKALLAPLQDGLEEVVRPVCAYCRENPQTVSAHAFWGVVYYYGLVVEKDEDKAIDELQAAAVRHDKLAQMMLAEIYLKKEDYEKSIYWVKEGAKQGNAECQALLGLFYCNDTENKLVGCDYAKAREYYEKSAAQGCAAGQAGLGKMYLWGWGVDEDDDKAIALFRQAAEQQDDNALCGLGHCYRNGWGCSKDSGKAAAYYQQAAKSGNSEAQVYLAICRIEGDGVEPAVQQGLKELQACAEQGIYIATKYLADWYSDVPVEGEEAVRAFGYQKIVAEAGEVTAMYSLACAYLTGKGTDCDETAAWKWMKKAADLEYPPAMYEFANHLLTVEGIARDERKAGNLIKKAADAGYWPAVQDYACCLENGLWNIKQDKVKAVKLFTQCVEQGMPRAMYYLAGYYRAGEVVAQDDAKYVDLLCKAAEAGVPEAQRESAINLLDFDQKEDAANKEAVRLLQQAAEQGDAEAQLWLGFCYEEGCGIAQDAKKAVDCYKRAARVGLARAQFELGACYRDGRGTAKNEKEAFEWFKKAARQGEAYAANAVGLCYLDGIGVSGNLGEAFAWFKKSAENGFSWGMYNLGMAYQNSWGTVKDDTKAFTWYKRAYEQGLAAAAYRIGLCYEDGRGVPKADRKTAEKWFKIAADAGDEDAQAKLTEIRKIQDMIGEANSNDSFAAYEMGLRFEEGRGVDQDYAAAQEYFLQAAANGHVEAQIKVGQYYRDGTVTRDLVRACQWFSNAAMQQSAEGQFLYGLSLMNGMGTEVNKKEALKWIGKASEQGYDKASRYLAKYQEENSGEKSGNSGCGGCGCLFWAIIILAILSKLH